MYGIDTNVLVRYLVQDDPTQSRDATKFIEKNCTSDTPGFVNCIVLCELVWVLESAYGFERQIIAAVLEKIIFTRQLRVENLATIQNAIQAYINQGVDFADYLISSINQQHNCQKTISFDKRGIKCGIFVSPK